LYFLDAQFLGFVVVWVAVYWLAGSRFRNSVLLAGNVLWLSLFSLPTLIALSGLALGVIYPTVILATRAHQGGDARRANTTAWIGIIAVIAIATALRLQGDWFHLVSSQPNAARLLRWIGFSYFLLKAIHLMRATARGIVAKPSLTDVLQYFLFLPTLTSGPLYRIDVFSTQLATPKTLSWADIQDGSLRVLLGIGKKVVFAQQLSKLTGVLHADSVWQPAAYPVTYLILFIDFSGYTDIAIGIGRWFGFTVPENFKHPFTSTTLTQFWRNWHATLSDWLRENVFVPMGGMRATGWKLSALVLCSMLVVGVWHAYRLKFLLWGLYHGVLLLVENALDVKPLRTHRTPLWRLGLRYALVQLAVMGGMFAFIGADLG
jgi:D-alanyl-lipoteichoic acid acyltransferase DltB (MBOAT superfamily)